MDRKADIAVFVRELLTRNGDMSPLDESGSFLLSGRLQSVDAVEIVMFLEEKYGIDFAQIGFDQALIDSIDAIEKLIETCGTK